VSKTAVTTRPRLKHAMTATAFSFIQARNAWKAYFKGLVAERRELARKQQRGWGG
jgi:hypothetical protein